MYRYVDNIPLKMIAELYYDCSTSCEHSSQDTFAMIDPLDSHGKMPSLDVRHLIVIVFSSMSSPSWLVLFTKYSP
jgi:uncharacterized protein YuzB (UPF0349 family)